MERATGLEPASSAWKAKALPLDDTRKFSKSNNGTGVRTRTGKVGFGDQPTSYAHRQIGVTDGN